MSHSPRQGFALFNQVEHSLVNNGRPTTSLVCMFILDVFLNLVGIEQSELSARCEFSWSRIFRPLPTQHSDPMAPKETRSDADLKYQEVLPAKYVSNPELLSSELAKAFKGERFDVEVSSPPPSSP